MRAKDFSVIFRIEQKLTNEFEIVNTRPINFYLCFKFTWNQEKKILKLFQSLYINKILAKLYFNQVKISNMTMKKTFLLPNKVKETTIAK